MAEKDIQEKVLMSHVDVFADCVNVLMCDGQKALHKKNLRPAPTESFYRGKKRIRNQFCDKSYYRVGKGEIKSQYIIENETKLRRRQVLRKASYQGGVYREQMDGKKPVYPVICMVLDWTGKRTGIPRSLKELTAGEDILPQEMQMMDDVMLTIYHMRNLSAETRERFTSDMGFVADYLNEGSFEKRREQKIVHVEELCEMMTALTGDTRFTEQVEELLDRQKEKEGVKMCEYIDMLEARGEEKGQIKGENRLAGLIQLLLKDKRYGDIESVSVDSGKRQELYRLYGI